jgi:hypothetical protein
MENLNRYARIFVKKYCFLTIFLDGVTVKYGIKERNYNSFLNKEETMNLTLRWEVPFLRRSGSPDRTGGG